MRLRILVVLSTLVLLLLGTAACLPDSPAATPQVAAVNCRRHPHATACTTTTTAAPATTRPSTTATVAPTTVAASTTTTTVPATTTTTVPSSPGCGLAQAAFCETFDAPRGDPNTRSGDLDPVLWGVSRIGNPNPGGLLNTVYPATMLGCGNQTVLPPQTVKICGGQLHEVTNDHTLVTLQAMYPKQPFDIAGRTGKVVFDVSDDSEGTHAAWPEFWWTDQPAPAPGDDFPIHDMTARNALGVSLAASDTHCVGVDAITVIRNYALEQVPFSDNGCVLVGSPSALNHFEMRISQTRVEVWGTDGGSTTLKLVAVAANPNITMTRGVIWIEDGHYNAAKGLFGNGTQQTHTFVWDNVGFDGPKTYRDLTFDVQEAHVPNDGGQNEGWSSNSPTLTVNGVRWDHTPARALVTFNFWGEQLVVPSFTLNGHVHNTAWPFPDSNDFTWRTLAVEVPLSEVLAGTNTIKFSTGDFGIVANINIALIDAADVPGGSTPPPTTTTTTTNPTTTSSTLVATTTTGAPGGSAFSEDFSGPANTTGNRNGPLSVTKFSVSRWRGELDPGANQHVTGGPGLPGDIAVTGGRAVVQTGSQNYGDTSIRINQPFDIAGRTGVVRFDASLYRPDGLWGWTTFGFTSDPYNAPSYQDDNAAGPDPAEGVTAYFEEACGMPLVRSYSNHVETDHGSGLTSDCTQLPSTASGKLNRVEVRISQSHIEIWASGASNDGVTFGPLVRLFAQDIPLSFSRGFLYFGGHNHATIKYGGPATWTTYWDNISFDGPVVAGRNSQVDNSGPNPFGWALPQSPALTPVLVLPGVVPGASARLVLDVAGDEITNPNVGAWRLNYRLNGGTLHTVTFTPSPAHSFLFTIPVNVAELVSGTNTVQFSGSGMYGGYQPYLANVDLVT